MLKLFFTLCVTLIIGLPQAFCQILPTVIARDLNKKPVIWPKDFTAEHTILLVAFTRQQQPVVDAWVTGLQLKTPGAPAWFEVPVIKNPGGFVRGFIDNGMRRGIPSVEARAHVVTLYTDKTAFKKAVGLPDEDVHVLVVAKDGKVIARQSGIHTVVKATAIEDALKR